MLETLDMALNTNREAPLHARELVERFTRDRLPARQRERAQLLVSEMTSNAVVYGGREDPLRLQLALDEELLHVDLTDAGEGFNAPTHPTPHEDHGFGLFLLDAAADRWGVAQDKRCRVWFELDRRST